MKLSSCDITSCNDLRRYILLQQKDRIGGAPEGVQTAWLSLGSALKMPPMHKRVEITILLPRTVPISDGEAFIPVWASGCRLSTMFIASSLMGGCGLSHKRVEDGCKSTCVEFGG